MKSVCAAEMPFAREAFGTLGDVMLKPGRAIGPADVRDAEILATRSTTRIDGALLAGSRVRFVGTATIGFDHIDTQYCEANSIPWYAAAGCNAESVAEYITAALLSLAVRHGFGLAGTTLGVVGVGNVGSRVVDKAHALGMQVLLNDPPRARRQDEASDGHRTPCPFLPLDEVLAGADIVTLHVPLTREGPDCTLHLAADAFFEQVKSGALFINSARGAVLDTAALLRALDTGRVAHAVIDTWEGEPKLPRALLARTALGTPHIAGYSYDGKVRGTLMVYREACRVLGVAPAWTPEACMPEPEVPAVHVAEAGRGMEAALHDVVRRVYDIAADDAALRRDPAAFDTLRRNYPVRREFAATRVTGSNTEGVARLAALGFRAA
jgi:erythronate-4-phosphate dehydrogenase